MVIPFFKIFLGIPTGKRPSGRPRRRLEDNIRMDLKEIGINSKNWVDAAQDRDYWRALVNAALNLHGVSYCFIRLLNLRDWSYNSLNNLYINYNTGFQRTILEYWSELLCWLWPLKQVIFLFSSLSWMKVIGAVILSPFFYGGNIIINPFTGGFACFIPWRKINRSGAWFLGNGGLQISLLDKVQLVANFWNFYCRNSGLMKTYHFVYRVSMQDRIQ